MRCRTQALPLSGCHYPGQRVGALAVISPSHCLALTAASKVKARATGFRQLYEFLDGADLLIIRADRCEPLVVLPLKLAIEIATAAERGKVPP